MFNFLRKKIDAFTQKMEPKIKLSTKIKKTVIGKAVLSEAELDSAIESFELTLLEADVALKTAEKISQELKLRIKDTSFSRTDNIKTKLDEIFREVLSSVLDENKYFNVVTGINSKPYVILFLGPNGTGKTTTIAKFCHMLQKNNLSSVIAAADTFRAASIEQLEEHASKLNVKVIKQTYGSDPTAVAFDAVSHARANKIDVVLIDSAGRQETNTNLIEQIKKMDRVIKPDLKLFVGESQTGNALLDQINAYKEIINLDGCILTKFDTDIKGGSILSVIHEGIPVLYLGTGQKYSDLIDFDKNFLLDKMLSD